MKHHLNRVKLWMLRLFMLLILLNKVKANFTDTLYALDTNSNNNFRIDYDGLDFPDPQSLYKHLFSPQCMSASGVLGQALNLSGEFAKNISATLLSCINQILKEECTDYFNRPLTPSNGARKQIEPTVKKLEAATDEARNKLVGYYSELSISNWKMIGVTVVTTLL